MRCDVAGMTTTEEEKEAAGEGVEQEVRNAERECVECGNLEVY